jgi:signal transduction histidine kinase
MAMYHSDELAATVKILFEEFRNLQNEYFGNNSRGFITTINEEEKYFELWITEIDGSEINKQFFIEFEEKTTGKFIYKAWLTKQPYLISDLQGETLSKWLDYLSQTGFKIAPGLYGARRVNNFIYYSKGFIGITSSVPLSENSILLLQRFAKVFEQTYTRFLDLKNAEAREVIAIREASLDRVRGEIASMRTAEDLQRITPLVWRELTALGVPFFRCGLFIVDEPKEQIHFYLSTPDGKPLAALELDFKSITVTQEALANWRVQKVYTTHWSKEEFISFAKSLLEQGQIENTSTYQGGEEAPESLTLQFVPFKQGMLYVGSEIVLKEMHIESVKVLADAFSTAYARYEDFIKLELAKQQIEKALAELQATQKQLIQSEKMASLGELTAGIAHEIQNPLNFVNNFSEVNKEMLEELKAERLKPKEERDETLEAELINDVKDNSEKIHHHGKRAGDIVKGMLQHSRSGSGQKELTDINALCDEYLRLAYHGLRAKDKSFNATFETDFDASVDKINIVPQDIGRVILNLINNAFYAVGERRKAEGLPYEPTVTVSTKKIGDKVLISVQDNGTGIPPHIVDKIFQPFFTTKPTGQGTGLGLSLSYDIIKAHGGAIKVETREAEGTEFIIALTI